MLFTYCKNLNLIVLVPKTSGLGDQRTKSQPLAGYLTILHWPYGHLCAMMTSIIISRNRMRIDFIIMILMKSCLYPNWCFTVYRQWKYEQCKYIYFFHTFAMPLICGGHSCCDCTHLMNIKRISGGRIQEIQCFPNFLMYSMGAAMLD